MKTLIFIAGLFASSAAFAEGQNSTRYNSVASMASTAATSSASNVGGSQQGMFGVRNESGASNIAGAAISNKYENNTRVTIAETWTNGEDFSRTRNNGGTGYASSSQSGSSAASANRTHNVWSWKSW